MKQIISFKKELPFKTKVSDITSISLERDIKVGEEGIVTGVFHITGDYKMNEGSIDREEFSFDLPFDITLDPRYDIKTVETDVEDFYYDLESNDTLKVNIDLYVKAEYLPEPAKEEKVEDKAPEEVREEPKTIDIVPEKETIVPEKAKEEAHEDREDFKTDLFSNLDDSETYSTYYVYIVKEEDNIDKILNRYGITKDELEDYNDITDVKVGDKLIIPKCNEK